jgi:hypothetical protein
MLGHEFKADLTQGEPIWAAFAAQVVYVELIECARRPTPARSNGEHLERESRERTADAHGFI